MFAMLHFFPGKRLTKVLDRTAANPLSFNAHLVYSRLVYLAGHGQGSTQAQLARATGLERGKTVQAAVQSLLGHGLAVKQGRRWHAVQPAGEAVGWFAPRRVDKPDAAWHARLAYWWLGRGSGTCPVTIKQLATYFKLGSIAIGRRTQALVCTLLNLDRKTVRTAVARLREVELLDPARLRVLRPTEAQRAWFRDLPPRKVLQLSDLLDPAPFGDSAASVADTFTALAGLLRAADYTEYQIRSYFAWAIKLGGTYQVVEEFFLAFQRMFAQVERDHGTNRRTNGKYRRARNSHGLLKFETRKLLRDLRKRFNVR